MNEFEPGDRVRIDIPDPDDPDFALHGSHGTVRDVMRDDAREVTGRGADSMLYRVELDSGETRDLRGRDVRPPLEEI